MRFHSVGCREAEGDKGRGEEVDAGRGGRQAGTRQRRRRRRLRGPRTGSRLAGRGGAGRSSRRSAAGIRPASDRGMTCMREGRAHRGGDGAGGRVCDGQRLHASRQRDEVWAVLEAQLGILVALHRPHGVQQALRQGRVPRPGSTGGVVQEREKQGKRGLPRRPPASRRPPVPPRPTGQHTLSLASWPAARQPCGPP